MRREKILFEKALQKTTFILKYTGIQINYDEQPMKNTIVGHLRKRWFYIGNFICLTSAVFSVFGMMSYLSIQIIIYMTPCITFAFLGDIKSYYFLYHKDIVHDFVNTLKTLQTSEVSEEQEAVEAKFINKHLPFLYNANRLLLFMSYAAVSTFCVGPLVVISWQYWSTNEIKLFLPFTVWYPFDEYSYAGWPLAYLHQFWSVWVAMFFVYGPDCFFYTACTFVQYQFRCLQYDMEKLGPDHFKDKDCFNVHVGGLMHRHRELIRCVDMLNIIYGKSTLYNVISSSFTICFAGFNIMAIDNLVLMVPFVAFLMLGFIQIYMLCYFGDLLMRASIEVSDGIFNSEWYKVNASSMKCCLFILMRSLKPCKITALGYGDINLMTFSGIISSAWSYFTILNTMYFKYNKKC